jgi:putative copper resistance protein D
LVNPLIVVRDIHYASSVIVAGIVFFDLLVATPVLRADPRFSKVESSFRETTGKILWTSLALSIASAFAWLWLLSARIAGKGIEDVISDGTIWIVLTQTQFGFAWEMRLIFACLLAVCLLLRGRVSTGSAVTWLMVAASLLAGAYLGALAAAGHGTEGMGFEHNTHLAADVLHLNAAGLWLGALVPFALLLTRLRRFHDDGWVAAAATAAGRFSTLGILAVGILVVTGTINAAFLLGGLHDLIDTAYGRLLLLKLVLVAVMVCLAGVNRECLLPRLSAGFETDKGFRTVQRLVRNTLLEITLGLVIICIIGVLGIMVPAKDMASHLH